MQTPRPRCQVNYCDYGHETVSEVRRLPIGEDAGIILCMHHYILERKYRRANGDIRITPEWRDLPIYPF